ncbi:MAG: hypothetical protein KatS3mg011_2144 [Acidimicrobiia bacterium]|nr:MAG: hypothetical protein KatS3mg011_2144 [Acidimicrobiia bacterium]
MAHVVPGSRVRVITDTASDLTSEQAEGLGIDLVPIPLTGSPDRPELGIPSVVAYREAFRAAIDRGAEGVLCVTPSSRLSPGYETALLAAEAEGGPVKVLDSGSLGPGQAVRAVSASLHAATGRSLDDLVAVCLEERPLVRAVLGRATRWLAPTGVRPVIDLSSGEIRFRGLAFGPARSPISHPGPVSVFFHVGPPPAGWRPPSDGPIVELGPVLASLLGPGTVGVATIVEA